MINQPLLGGSATYKRLLLIISLLVISYGVLWGIWGQAGRALPTWVSIMPSLLAILLALLTRHVVLSLSIGVITGGYLAVLPDSPDGITFAVSGIEETASYVVQSLSASWNIQVILFLLSILFAITVMVSSGGLRGIINWLEPYAKGRRSAQFLTFFMGLLMFIDDYANIVLVGSSMRPICDKYRVSRQKLAFIVDSTSAPVAGIAFISTWIGYEVGQIGQVAASLNLPLEGYAVFFDIFRYRFYCIFMLLFMFLYLLFNVDFGPMARAEKEARGADASSHDTLVSNAAQLEEAEPVEWAVVTGWSAILPLGALLAYFVVGLWIDGNGMVYVEQSVWTLLSFETWRLVVAHASNSMLILMQAGILGLVVTLVCAKGIAKLSVKQIAVALRAGFRTARLPLIILLLAWSLKAACDALSTDIFLVSLLSEKLSPILLPVATFIMAAAVAISTGTSWGTMAILLPMIMPLGISIDGGQYGLTTMLALAAVLDGSIFGDHCSPISDTTVMSSISCDCELTSHVITQAPYALIVAALAMTVGYLWNSLSLPLWLSYGLAAGVITGIFYYFLLAKRRQEVKILV